MSLYSKLLEAKSEFPAIVKNQTADTGKYKYKYVDLATVLSAVEPVLAKHGILLLQRLDTNIDGQFHVFTSLRLTEDSEDESIISEACPIVMPESKQGDPQAMGSAITYARRYSVITILGIAPDEDDDAQSLRTPDPKSPVAPLSPQEGGKTQRFTQKVLVEVSAALNKYWEAHPGEIQNKTISAALKHFDLYPSSRPIEDGDLIDLLHELEAKS